MDSVFFIARTRLRAGVEGTSVFAIAEENASAPAVSGARAPALRGSSKRERETPKAKQKERTNNESPTSSSSRVVAASCSARPTDAGW